MHTLIIYITGLLYSFIINALPTVPADSLSDHLLAHSMEESDCHLLVDSERSKNDFSSLKVCGIYYMYIALYKDHLSIY